MDNDRFVLHERPVSFIITPDAFRLRVGGRPSEHTPEHLQGSIDPAILLDRSRSITLDARDEQDNQDTLAPALQRRSSPDGLLAPLRRFSINIDRYRVAPQTSDRCDPSANELLNARGLLLADASDLGQGTRVSGEDTFDGAKVTQQSMRQRRADAGKALQQEQPLRREPFRLPVESAQSSL